MGVIIAGSGQGDTLTDSAANWRARWLASSPWFFLPFGKGKNVGSWWGVIGSWAGWLRAFGCPLPFWVREGGWKLGEAGGDQWTCSGALVRTGGLGGNSEYHRTEAGNVWVPSAQIEAEDRPRTGNIGFKGLFNLVIRSSHSSIRATGTNIH